MTEKSSAGNVSVGKPERKKPHRSLEHRWKDNIKMHLKEIARAWNVLM
jgi:hypothetical protein